VFSKEAECLTDTRLEMKARPLACKVSALCPLLKVCGNSAQSIYSHTVIIFEVQQTRDSFGKFLVKLEFHSYIALVGERNVSFGGGSVGCEIEQQHEIQRYKHAVSIAAPRSSEVCLIP
jgi:hypothetical protein